MSRSRSSLNNIFKKIFVIGFLWTLTWNSCPTGTKSLSPSTMTWMKVLFYYNFYYVTSHPLPVVSAMNRWCPVSWLACVCEAMLNLPEVLSNKVSSSGRPEQGTRCAKTLRNDALNGGQVTVWGLVIVALFRHRETLGILSFVPFNYSWMYFVDYRIILHFKQRCSLGFSILRTSLSYQCFYSRLGLFSKNPDPWKWFMEQSCWGSSLVFVNKLAMSVSWEMDGLV